MRSRGRMVTVGGGELVEGGLFGICLRASGT
jgi:hypothetical protein